jgi:hypothetical protein
LSSPWREYTFLIHFIDVLFLKLLAYDGPYLDWAGFRWTHPAPDRHVGPLDRVTRLPEDSYTPSTGTRRAKEPRNAPRPGAPRLNTAILVGLDMEPTDPVVELPDKIPPESSVRQQAASVRSTSD